MKKILVVEDSVEQHAVATNLLKGKGYQYILVKNLEEAQAALQTGSFDGVLTDLHFPERETSEIVPPCGFAVLVICCEKALPVVVVSDIDHHFAAYAKIVIEGITKLHPKGSIPFVMDSKDWESGLRLLEEVCQ